ncbi:MAG: macro domain-containing protein [Clostridia bacterium]|nr:macro domain-containing protein [Clostridia bacterium]
MPFQIIRNDITQVKADAIVNTANPMPVIGSGTESAIYHAAGEKALLAKRRKIGDIAPGNAAVTPAFQLPAKYIIHTVGPFWVDGKHGEQAVLRSCYAASLEIAADLSVQSVAFPLIATGVYGFPREEALNIALSEISKFLLTHDMKVILVVFDCETFELSEVLVGKIEAYIDDHGVGTIWDEEYDDDGLKCARSARRGREMKHHGWERLRIIRRRREMEALRIDDAAFSDASTSDVSEDTIPDAMVMPELAAPTALPDMGGKSLDEVLDDAGPSFQQRLFELIDRSGMDDVSVYKKANIDRKVFSRIRCNADYRPKKKTAVAFAIALRLDMPTMLDLLSRAEIALSPSNKFDLIISYFVTNGNYDIYEINAALFKYGQPILGE